MGIDFYGKAPSYGAMTLKPTYKEDYVPHNMSKYLEKDPRKRYYS